MTGSRFLRLYLVLLAAGPLISALDEGESVAATMSPRNLRSRIVGGTKADPKRYPYSTFLEIVFKDSSGNLNLAHCGGTLIAKDVVLTAAHCFAQGSLKPWSIDAWVNCTSFDWSPYEYFRTATYYLKHTFYKASTHANDIALAFLDESVTGVTLAKINKRASTPAVGKAVTAIGLGLIKRPPEVDTTYLRQVSMTTLDGSSCLNAYGSSEFKKLNHICAGSTKGTCQGDSGGPLLLKGTTASKDVVVGITSYGLKAGCGLKPSAYTRVSKYAPWINSAVCNYSSYPPTTCP